MKAKRQQIAAAPIPRGRISDSRVIAALSAAAGANQPDSP
jgi:hypothetical protein